MKITKESIDIAARVVTGITERSGRAADGGISLPFLISMAQMAGDGDHVDIGSLYGASAIGVALMKKETGQEGGVYCIDPYDNEKRDQTVHAAGPIEGEVSASAEALLANAEHFEVELKLLQVVSDPWPEELKDNTFVSGQHYLWVGFVGTHRLDSSDCNEDQIFVQKEPVLRVHCV